MTDALTIVVCPPEGMMQLQYWQHVRNAMNHNNQLTQAEWSR